MEGGVQSPSRLVVWAVAVSLQLGAQFEGVVRPRTREPGQLSLGACSSVSSYEEVHFFFFLFPLSSHFSPFPQTHLV